MISHKNPYNQDEPVDVMTVDIETTIRNVLPNKVGSNKGSPHCADNEIVLIGSTYNGVVVNVVSFIDFDTEKRHLRLFENTTVLVGHNIKFDLLYLMREWVKGEGNINAHLRNLFIWDTMVVEYLLSGQQERMANLSLEKVANRYSIPFKKDDRIKAYWDAGVDTNDIPRDILEEYLKDDVYVTNKIYREQVVKAIEMDMIPLIYTRMEQWLATVIMEHNGMYIDTNVFVGLMADVQKEMEEYKRIADLYFGEGVVDSPAKLKMWFYGGTEKVTSNVPMLDADGNELKFKSGIKKGQVRTKKVVSYAPVLARIPTYIIEHMRAEDCNTSEETLKALLTHDIKDKEVVKAIRNLLSYREKAKEYSTYFVGVGNYIWPDSKIHGNLNEAITVTGRLASSNPNLQNLPSYSEE